MPDLDDELATVGAAFILAAYRVLAEQHVIPPPTYHPWLAIGRDYFGSELMALPEFVRLEGCLRSRNPERFVAGGRSFGPEFPNTYIFSLLEGCVTYCAAENDFSPSSAGIRRGLGDLTVLLAEARTEIVCARHVSHLTTSRGQDVKLSNGILVVPGKHPGGDLTRRIQREIPVAARAWNRDDPRPFDPPHSLIIVRDESDDPSPYSLATKLSARIERFLMLTRLLTGGTVHSNYEITGAVTIVSRIHPSLRTYSQRAMGSLVQRIVRISGDESAALEALNAMITAAKVNRDGMAATSFDVALGRFNLSHTSESAYEHLVDLATALEATLIGEGDESEAISLRLRGRCAALLATESDPAQRIFEDIGNLYALRSKVIHGGQIKDTDLRRSIAKISTVPTGSADSEFAVALGLAVDRLRDLVRRAILARLCLASGPDPVWPFGGSTAIDAILSDDAQRLAWRSRWRAQLDAVHAGSAANKPTAASGFLSPDWTGTERRAVD